MKLLHVPFCYYPDPVGGTEVYVASLARAQQNRGHDVAVAAPADSNATYVHDAIAVHRFGIGSNLSLRQLYGEGDPVAADNFERILDRLKPDILHLHAFTSAISGLLPRLARLRNIPVVFTYHTPTNTCCRGTMLEFGDTPCDGEMRVKRCSSCMLHGKGLSKSASRLLGSVPSSVGSLAGVAGLEGGRWTAFRSTELVAIRHAAVKRFLSDETDHIFAVCEWVRKVLANNGVPDSKLTLSRQGTAHPSKRQVVAHRGASAIRFAFLGRLDPTKGVPILIEALAMLPDLELQLDIFAVTQTDQARRQHADLLAKARTDQRIRFLAPLEVSEVVAQLGECDALLVPSQWLETGPLVVYEAFSAGIPVIGSRLGGLSELIADGTTGLLVDAASPAAWANAIKRIIQEPGLLQRLKDAPKPSRTAEDSADDMSPVYMRLLKHESSLATVGGVNRL